MSHTNTKAMLANVAERNRKVRRLEARVKNTTNRVERLRKKGHTNPLDSPELRQALRAQRYAQDDLRYVRGY